MIDMVLFAPTEENMMNSLQKLCEPKRSKKTSYTCAIISVPFLPNTIDITNSSNCGEPLQSVF